jgi:uncharacterized protein YjbI with pentapeptide repeats
MAMPRALHTNGSAPAQTPAAGRHEVPRSTWWEQLDAPSAPPPSLRQRLARPSRVGAGCLGVTAAVTLGLRSIWPEVAPAVAFCVGAIFLAGLVLWWANRSDSGAKSTLGAALLGGTLVAIAVFGIQADLDAGRQVAAEQQALRLTLGLQQDLSGIDLAGNDLTSFYLRGKNLTQAVLAGADLTLVNLSGAELREADLTGADLGRAHLASANLQGADLSDADLSGADLFAADLSDAMLSGADLSGTFLASTDLSNALLVGADLSGADLSGARLDGAILEGAVVDGATQWPIGFDWHAAGVTRRR